MSVDGVLDETASSGGSHEMAPQHQEEEGEVSDDSALTTTTASKSITTTKLGFGSCHKNRKASMPPIWDTIGKESIDGWIWVGDAMYPSSRNPLTGKKRYGPAPPSEIQQGFEELRNNVTIGYKPNILDRQIKVYGTWDDHDYGGNDMGNNMKEQQQRKQILFDFLGYDETSRPNDHPGVYHSIDHLHNGDLQLIMLDTRWFREEHCVPSLAHILPMGNAIACATRWLTAGLNLAKYVSWWGSLIRGGGGNDSRRCEHNTFLGQEQWGWLESTLFESQAKVHIIVSSIQIWTTNPAMESWGQYPTEQQKLYNLLQRHYDSRRKSNLLVSPVIFLSGDVHHGEIIGSSQSGLLEVTSSGLTHHCGQPFLYGRLCQPILETFHLHRTSPTQPEELQSSNGRDDHSRNKNKSHTTKNFYVGINYGILTLNDTTVHIEVKDSTGSTVLQVVQPYGDGRNSHAIPPHFPSSYDELPHTWDGHLIPMFQGMLVAILISILILRRSVVGSR